MATCTDTGFDTTSFVESEIRIVILGKTGTGKSTLGNLLAGNKHFQTHVGFQSVTKQCKLSEFEYKGTNIQIVDTPGFCDTEMSEEDVKRELIQCLVLTSPGIHSVLFTIRIGRFTGEDQDVLHTFLKMFGKDIINHVVIIFTGKDELDFENKTYDDIKDNNPPELQRLIEDCKGRLVVLDARMTNRRDTYMGEIIGKIPTNANRSQCYTNDMFRAVEVEMIKAEIKTMKEVTEKNKENHEKQMAQFVSRLETLTTSKEASETEIKRQFLQSQAKYEFNMRKFVRQGIRNGLLNGLASECLGSAWSFAEKELLKGAGQGIGGMMLKPTGEAVGQYLGAAVGTAVGGYCATKIGPITHAVLKQLFLNEADEGTSPRVLP